MKTITTLIVGIALALAIATPASSKTVLPGWWYKQAMCIHKNESIDWKKTTTWQGYPSNDHGGMQIDVHTWQSEAPRGFPSDPAYATPHQQLIVAYKIWLMNGRRWGGNQWPHSAPACGLN